MKPELTYNLFIGGVTGFLISIATIGVLTGIQIFGSGLSDESIHIIFGIVAMMNIFFSINISGFQIGLGLLTNMIGIFTYGASTYIGDFLSFGFLLSTTIGLLAFISGLIIVVQRGG